MAVEYLAASAATVVSSAANTETTISAAYDSLATGSNRLLAVVVCWTSGAQAVEANRKNVASMTYNGVSLTRQRRQLYTGSASASKTNCDIWTLLAPATGSNTLATTFNNPTEENDVLIIAGVYTGVSAVTATGDTGNGSGTEASSFTDLGFTFGNAANYALIGISMAYNNFGPIDGVSGWTVDHEAEIGGSGTAPAAVALGHYQTDAASAKTFTWSPNAAGTTSGQYQSVAIELEPSTGASISVDDATIDPTPTTVITITKTAVWNGTVTATIEGTAISLTAINTTQKSFTVDIPDLLPGGAWNAIRPSHITPDEQYATLAVTDSDGTFTTEVELLFSPSLGEDYVNSPGAGIGTYIAVPGAVTGDPQFAFWHLGDGVRNKTIFGSTDAGTGYFAPVTLPSQGRLIAYDVSGAVWLAHVDTGYFTAPLNGGDMASVRIYLSISLGI